MNRRIILQLATLVLTIIFAPTVFAAISQKDARNAITKTAGMSLPRGAVHTNRITSSTNFTAEVSADLDLPFRFEEKSGGRWRIDEIRVAQGSWEDMQLFIDAAKLTLAPESCETKNPYQKVHPDLTTRRARCLVADLFGVSLPSDAVRIKSLAVQGFGPRSALVETVITADFRLKKGARGWYVSEMRTGSRDWIDVEGVPATIDSAKRDRANAQMSEIAAALDAYRSERGSFVVTDKHQVLIDQLNPQFLHSVIRLDPWHNNYHYEGEPNRFTLRSLGPDGKENTPDDIVLSK